MKKRIIPVICSILLVLTGCVAESEKESGLQLEAIKRYSTELVPGIIDEEQRTEESFNIRDVLNKSAEAAEGFGHRFAYMMHTLIVSDRNTNKV